VKCRPEAVARAAKVVADGGGVETGVYARKEDDEVFGREIREGILLNNFINNLILLYT